MRKVRFIEPGSRQGRPMNAWLKTSPLLGPVTLATILREKGFDSTVYNENISGPLPQNSAFYDDICTADVAAITIMTPTAMRGYELADSIKQEAPHVTVALGGPHATFMSEEALEHCDIVCCGEGENVIADIANGKISAGIVSPAHADLDSIPTPDFETVTDFEKAPRRFSSRLDFPLPLMTARGCPHGCSYCSVTRMFGRKIRCRNIDNVIQDIRNYQRKGYSSLFFYDDNFTAFRERTKKLLSKMLPLSVNFRAQTRIDFAWSGPGRRRIDRDLLEAMHKAGGQVLYVGYETIDEQTAEAWNKGYSGPETLKHRMQEDTRILHDGGFWIHSMFICGPHNTGRDIKNMVNFARQNRIESMHISILTPFPGTPVFKQMEPYLFLNRFPQDWDYYDGSHCTYKHGKLAVPQLQRLLIKAHLKFYGFSGIKPERLKLLLKKRKTLLEKAALLWNQARTGKKVIKHWSEETKRFIEEINSRSPDKLHCKAERMR